jgi:hypothetical protein
MLIFNLLGRLAYYTVIAFLAGFTAYLFVLPYFFEMDISNCQCFGNTIIFNRTQSIIKNLALLLCFLFISPKYYTHNKWKTWAVVVLCITTLAIFMIINAPNYFYTLVHKEKLQIDVPLYESALVNSGMEADFSTGKQIICLYSIGCKFCKQSALKLHLILKNNKLPENLVKAVFWEGTPDSLIYNFLNENKIPLTQYTTFRVDTFLNITNGHLPIILLSDNGKILHKADYVTLSEREVVGFLKCK